MITFEQLWENSVPSKTYKTIFEDFQSYYFAYSNLLPNVKLWGDQFLRVINSLPEYPLTPYGLDILKDRVLVRDPETSTIMESPKHMLARVASALADTEQEAIEFFTAMYHRKYMPSSPILFNAGLERQQLSSCYIHTVPDSIDGIFKSYADMAHMAKYAGGIGTDWTYVRSFASTVQGLGRSGAGLIPWMKIQDDVCLAVNQGGRRKGAHCLYLEVWHKEIFEFVKLRKQIGDDNRLLRHCHTAVWIPDRFMQEVERDGYWYLFCPSKAHKLHEYHGIEFDSLYAQYVDSGLYEEQIKARDLWRHILNNLVETGHPWITFKDRCNEYNKFIEPVLSSNLCTEITLPTAFDNTAVCTLSSINLASHCSPQEVYHTAQTVTKFLNKIIDKSWYPTKEAEYHAKKYRPLGLGVMGYQDALQQRGIIWGSEEHQNYDNYCFKVIRDGCASANQNNFTYTAIAPTVTISALVGASPSIEPYYANVYNVQGLSGTYTLANPQWLKFMQDSEQRDYLLEQQGNNDPLFKTAFELDQNLITEAAARRQQFICQSQSVNYYNNFITDDKGKSGQKLSDMYMHAWRQGLKTTYYLRSHAASKAATSLNIECSGCQ